MSRPRVFLLKAASAIAFFAGCAADSPPPFEDVDVASATANPDGVAYPTDHLGAAPRTEVRAGSRIPNLSFVGYVDSQHAAGLRTVSLADYFDPTAQRHKLLQISAMATWCSICASQADATVSVKDALSKRGVVFLEIMVNGNRQSVGPSLLEVESWISSHRTTFTVLIDARARRTLPLGVAAVPWNALVDTRTMEILDSGVGAPRDIVAYVATGLAFVERQPPSY